MAACNCSEISKNVCRLLNLDAGDSVEMIARGNQIIIRRGLTVAEKRKKWVNDILPAIDPHPRFVTGRTMIFKCRGDKEIQKSALPARVPSHKSDIRVKMCIAYCRSCDWEVPDYVFED